jgi:hypothetical protein
MIIAMAPTAFNSSSDLFGEFRAPGDGFTFRETASRPPIPSRKGERGEERAQAGTSISVVLNSPPITVVAGYCLPLKSIMPRRRWTR